MLCSVTYRVFTNLLIIQSRNCFSQIPVNQEILMFVVTYHVFSRSLLSRTHQSSKACLPHVLAHTVFTIKVYIFVLGNVISSSFITVLSTRSTTPFANLTFLSCRDIIVNYADQAVHYLAESQLRVERVQVAAVWGV